MSITMHKPFLAGQSVVIKLLLFVSSTTCWSALTLRAILRGDTLFSSSTEVVWTSYMMPILPIGRIFSIYKVPILLQMLGEGKAAQKWPRLICVGIYSHQTCNQPHFIQPFT